MPPIEEVDLHQKAVLWPFAGYDRNGEPTVGDPEEIDVRWNPTQTEMMDNQNNTIAVDATVVVLQDVAVDSRMWLGELDDFNGTGSANEDLTDSMMQVKVFTKTPSINARVFRRTVGLVRKQTDLTTGA